GNFQPEKLMSGAHALKWPKPISTEQSIRLALFLWFALGLLVSAPGLATRTPYYDEITETRFALEPVLKQALHYLNPDELYLIDPGVDHRPRAPINAPPLYHVILHPVLLVLGVTPFSIRCISWIAGGINVCLIYIILKRILPSPWPILGTLGYLFSSWHIILSQTARMHNLFVMFVLLSIVLFYNIMKKDRGVLLYTMYTAALAAACHTYYWGLIAVLPSHIVATFLMRREVKSWHRALVCQL